MKEDLIQGVKVVLPRLESSIWLELQKDFFKLQIEFVYIAPGLLKSQDPLQHIREGINRTGLDTGFVIMGNVKLMLGWDSPNRASPGSLFAM